jgi:hypothetical protein
VKASTFSFFTAAFAATAAVGVLVGGCTNDAPTSCPKALDAAEVVMHKAEDALDATSDAITAFVAGNGAGIAEANGRLTALTSAVQKDITDYNRLAAECRGGS